MKIELSAEEAEELPTLLNLAVANIGGQMAQGGLAAIDDGRAIRLIAAAKGLSKKLATPSPAEPEAS